MTLKRRLERLEQQAAPDLNAVMEWAQRLELDDLRCVIATGPPDGTVTVPAGMTLEQAIARGYELLRSAPEEIRRPFAMTDEETA